MNYKISLFGNLPLEIEFCLTVCTLVNALMREAYVESFNTLIRGVYPDASINCQC